jgi:hypothetical protein
MSQADLNTLGTDEKRWNFSERRSEPFDGVHSGQTS